MNFKQKQCSLLTVAQIELKVLDGQYFGRRIPDIATVQAIVEACQNQRNKASKPIDWQFMTNNARIKLKKLYPNL